MNSRLGEEMTNETKEELRKKIEENMKNFDKQEMEKRMNMVC